MSTPELARLGSALLSVAAVTGVLSLMARRRKVAVIFGAIALVALVAGLAAATDVFCLTGYRIEDGSCAWE